MWSYTANPHMPSYHKHRDVTFYTHAGKLPNLTTFFFPLFLCVVPLFAHSILSRRLRMNVAMPLLCAIVVLTGTTLPLPYHLLFLPLFACSLLRTNLFMFPYRTAEAGFGPRSLSIKPSSDLV
jgi:hypothetical protein